MAWPRFLRRLLGGGAPQSVSVAERKFVAAPVGLESDDDVNDDVDDDGDDEGNEDDDNVARDPVLEAKLRESPRDPAPHMVYADWLQQRGNPRGELIVIHHELETGVLTPERREALEERAQEIRRTHWRLVSGPLETERVQLRLGFARQVFVESELPATRDLERALAHPAYVVLESLVVDADDVERVRSALAALGRGEVRVSSKEDYLPHPDDVPRAVATVTVRTDAHGQRWVSVASNDSFGLSNGSHSFLLRCRLASGTWSYGCDASLCEESLADDPVRSEAYPCAVDDRELTVELRFGIENDGGVVTMWFRGVAALSGDGHSDLVLAQCTPHTGPPFASSPTIERAAARGPQLVVGEPYRAGCVPGHGVVTGFHRYVTPTGTRALHGREPHGVASSMTGGSDGTIVANYSPTWSKNRDESITSILMLHVGKAVSVPVRAYVARMDAFPGARVGVVTTGHFTVYDARSGAVIWQRKLETWKDLRVDTGHVAVVEHDGGIYLWEHDRVVAYRLDTGAPHGEPCALPALAATMKNYGVGDPAFHPAPGRIAWMACASSGYVGQPPATVIAWRDRDGTGGEVAIAEEGRVLHTDAFGHVAVLPDGRIVAVGESVWLVEPPSLVPVRIGDAGGYNGPLQLTRHGACWRLWNPGPGPWYLELA